MSEAAATGAPLDIAIVGMSGAYAGATDMRRYWQNILDKVDSVDEAPPGWSHDNYDPDSDANDRIYTRRGGFLGKEVAVDPISFGVLPSVAAGGDPDHLIALTYARDALVDAGLFDTTLKRIDAGTDPHRAGVILGRGTYGNRGMSSMIARGLFVDQAMAMARGLRPDLSAAELHELREHFKSQLPPYDGQMVGPLTPNVVAGMIANRLNLMGPSFIVDAACASTLMALDAAVRELASGRCDVMITGGVHSQTPAQLYIQFCQINALSHGNLRPFQKGADGTLLGEGVGILVLKRRADAERDGNRIYALIQGIGTSSDGRAKGFLAPRLEGQVLALERAYSSCGIDPTSLGYIEAHGTGTMVGDRCEIETLRQVFGDAGGPRIALGSVKSMIGHCLPAAASASLIKTALALHHKILPPTLCGEPDPSLAFEHSAFYINNETRPWIHGGGHPRRAGVNAFGFGGANAHVVMEEYQPPTGTQISVLHRPRPSELLALAAGSVPALRQLIGHVLAHLRGGTALSSVARSTIPYSNGNLRLAVVADNERDATKKLEQALKKITDGEGRPFKTRSGIHLGRGAAPGKLCFLYPGEGAQYPGMLSELCLNFPSVRRWFDFFEDTGLRNGKAPRAPILFPPPTGLSPAQRKALEGRLYEMDVAAESIYCATLGMQALLDELGFKPDAMLGHSTGENTAITASGIYRPRHAEELAEVVHALNDIYQRLSDAGRIVDGTLLTVGGLSEERRRGLLAGGGNDDTDNGIVVAMDNCPNQLVLFGTSKAIEKLHEVLAAEGGICAELPFGRAYHTAHFKPMADAVGAYFAGLEFGPGHCALYSARSAGSFPDEPDAIRSLAASQWDHPVRFHETLQRLHDDGFRVFVELGPSANLTGFVNDSLREHKDVVAVSCDNRRRGGVAQLHRALAQLFSAGVGFDLGALYAHRDVAQVDITQAPAPPGRPPITVKLEMPKLSLPENWAPLQRQPPAQAARAMPATTSESAATDTATTSSPASSPAAVDPRSTLLRSHFSLMNAFLASQARVLDRASGNASTPTPTPAAPPPAPSSEAFPLLGQITSRDKTRLEARRRFDLRHDSVFYDHAIGGPPSRINQDAHALAVIPFTFSMEMAAEAAIALCNDTSRVVTGLDEVRGNRWLCLDDGTLDVRIAAERLPPQSDKTQRTRVRIFTLGGGNNQAAFETVVLTAAAWPAAPRGLAWPSNTEAPPHANRNGQLYTNGMFHGPRLQGVRHIHRWSEQSIDAKLATLPTADYFAFTPTPRFQLDPALLDAAGALVAYWAAERENWAANCLPFATAALRQYGPPRPAGETFLGRVVIRNDATGSVASDLDIIDTSTGTALVRITGRQDRKFRTDFRFRAFRLDPPGSMLSTPYGDDDGDGDGDGVTLTRMEPFSTGFLDEGGHIWMHVLAHMVLHPDELPEFAALPATGPRRAEWLMGRIAAKDAIRAWTHTHTHIKLACADIHIAKDDRGQPHATLPPQAIPLSISLSHSEGWGFGAAARGPDAIGVDYQQPRNVDTQALAAGALAAEEQRWLHDLPAAAVPARLVALWCAKEAAAKAAGTGLEGRPRDWHVTELRAVGERFQARVIHRHDAFTVHLMQSAEGECVAWCQHVASRPLPTLATA